jgi:hypothetical protein
MVWVQYPRRQAVAGVRSSRRQVANGLVITGLTVFVFGAAAGAGATLVIERYGRAFAAIPASIAVVGVALLVAGLLLKLRGRT